MRKRYWIFFGLLFFTHVSMAAATTVDNLSTSQRIFLLETALAPGDPQAVVTAWAKATKARNGAVQYMLLCPELQRAHFNNLEALNWVTGVSSPGISAYKILPQIVKEKSHDSENSSTFVIHYQFYLGKNAVRGVKDNIIVRPVHSMADSSQKFCISQVGYLSPVDGLSLQ